MAVKKQKRAAKSLLAEASTEKTGDQTEVIEAVQPTVKVDPPVEPEKPANPVPEANPQAKPSEELSLLKLQNEQILPALVSISERVGGLEERFVLQETSHRPVDQEAILSSLKLHMNDLFDVKRSLDYFELSNANERLRGEVDDLQLQLKAQYEKYAAVRLEMEEEREAATRLLQAARQREKALEQNVYQLNIREEELEELAVLNEELDAKMVSQSEEFAKRTQLFEEEIFALKTAEADYQTKIAELEAKLKAD